LHFDFYILNYFFMVNLSKKQFVIIGTISFVLIVLVLLVVFNFRGAVGGGVKTPLSIWGTDPESAWIGILKSYSALRPNVDASYTFIDPSSYKSAVLNALAAGKGPDIFYIGNHDLFANSAKLVPAGPDQFDLLKLRNAFPAVVEEDFLLTGQIGALPLYIDTLATIYNRDMFDQAGIATPPKTWDELLKDIPLLRKTEGGQISQAAAAIGGSEKSVDAATDLLTLLMIQNGAKMNNEEKTLASFASGGSTAFGYRAFDFYLQFANAASTYYTWNDSQPNSIDAFSRGKAAIIFNYSSVLPKIASLSPFLNVGVTPMLQTKSSDTDVNYASYQGLGVSSQSRSPSWAWDFIIYATTNETAARTYGDATGHPPALRSLIAQKSNDLKLNVFAKQALTARSWLVPSDDIVKEVFGRTIQSVLAGQVGSAAALKQAEGQINQSYSR